MDEILSKIVTSIMPILIAAVPSYLMISGAIIFYQKYLAKQKHDRRKDNSDWIERFIVLEEKNSHILDKLSEAFVRQETRLDKTLEHQIELKYQVERVHDKIVQNG